MTVYLRELDANPWTGHVENVWHVPPPEFGQKYRVIRERWDSDNGPRHIYEWEPEP